MHQDEVSCEESYVLSITRWEELLNKLIVNLSPMEKTGELRLMAALLSSSISEELTKCKEQDRDVFLGHFFNNGFVNYCGLIGVDSDQLKTAAIESFTLVGLDHE